MSTVWFRAAGDWAAPVKEADPQAELPLPGRGLRGQRQTEAKRGRAGGRQTEEGERQKDQSARAQQQANGGRRARSGVTAGAHLRWRARAPASEALWQQESVCG